MTDIELLRQHHHGSDAAFGLLVRRHLGWIHGMARRRLRDAHLAEDVVQAVFLLLHQKAPVFPGDGAMVSWLHKTTWYATEVTARSERRRRLREEKVAMIQPTLTKASAESAEWEQLAPLLDELICKLGGQDRQAVLLRFYMGMTFEEVGAQIGATAEAARKRVDRAIDKLRRWAGSDGLTLSAAAMAGHLSNVVHTAPPARGLIARTIVAATSGSSNGLAASSSAIAKGVTMIIITKNAVAVACGVAAFVCVAGTIWAVLPAGSEPAPKPIESPGANVAVSAQSTQPARTFTALAPFMRWNGDVPQLELNKQWYELVRLNDLPIAEFTDVAKQMDVAVWRRVFQEDLDLIFAAKKLPYGPFKLDLKRVDTGEAVTINNATATLENRGSLIRADEPDATKSTVRLFSAVRWQGGAAQVQVDGNDTWYVLDGIDDQSATQIYDFARRTYPGRWQTEFEGKTIDVLMAMGHRFPPGVALLHVRTLDTDKPLEISKRTHNLRYPVQPAAGQGYARLSPFSAIRWNGDNYDVEVNGRWSALVSLDGQPIEKIVEFSKSKFGAMWQKRIDEDLVEVLADMGHQPGPTVKLELKSLDTGDRSTIDDAKMTAENRRAVYLERNGKKSPEPSDGTQGL